MMNELIFTAHLCYYVLSYRWLKYEEKVEAGNRWSKPHVPTASLHALNTIKNSLETCTLLLDIKGKQNHLYPVAGEN